LEGGEVTTENEVVESEEEQQEEQEDYIYRSYHRRDCPTPWFHNNASHICPIEGTEGER
jgi:hypothetical protein